MLLSKRLIVILFVFVNFAITCQVDQYKDNSEEKKSSVKALNILFILGHFPAASQIFILNIITNLIDRGHKVSIFSFHKDDYVNMHPNIEKYNLLDRVTYNKLCEPFPECDIVFCQFGYLGKTIVRMKKLREWLKNKKLVVCFRGSDITSYLTQDVEMYQKLFKRIDLALPVCDYFREKLITLGCNTDKIVTHHSAIDCREFFLKIRKKPEKSVIRIVSVGRLVKKKGIDYAIKAFAHIAQRY
ncbi:MAG TPA: hypothetical protein VLB80_02960, partial [Candidatus Babeliales bacterium]|nr:hypothetical protein [Candidatus Babeliales bacterium]